jgi:hypothetical protein
LDSFLEFLSADEYKKSTVVVENLTEYINRKLGRKLSFVNKCRKAFDEFVKYLEEKSKSFFKVVGLYYWSPNAKILAFSLIFLAPAILVIVWAIAKGLVMFLNKREASKLARK